MFYNICKKRGVTKMNSTILLVCLAGESAKLLAQRIKEAASEKSELLNIQTCSFAEVDFFIRQDVKMILLAPHVSFLEKQLIEKIDSTVTSLAIIPAAYYGRMNGLGVLNLINNQLEQLVI